MFNVYAFSIIQKGYEYIIHVNETLYAIIKKKKSESWDLQLISNLEKFDISRGRGINADYVISLKGKNEVLGIITVPVIWYPNQSFRLETVSGEVYQFVIRNFFSLHWEWRSKGQTIIEGLEDIVQQIDTGIIRVIQETKDESMLVLLGIFLSVRRKDKVTLGMYSIRKKLIGRKEERENG